MISLIVIGSFPIFQTTKRCWFKHRLFPDKQISTTLYGGTEVPQLVLLLLYFILKNIYLCSIICQNYKENGSTLFYPWALVFTFEFLNFFFFLYLNPFMPDSISSYIKTFLSLFFRSRSIKWSPGFNVNLWINDIKHGCVKLWNKKNQNYQSIYIMGHFI